MLLAFLFSQNDDYLQVIVCKYHKKGYAEIAKTKIISI